jgi:hypothetical protein
MTRRKVIDMPDEDTRPEPFDKEKVRIAKARERWIERTPPVQVSFRDEGGRSVRAPHNDDSGHLMRMCDTFGTRSAEFLAIQLTELGAAVRTRGQREATEQQMNAGIAFVAAVAPENELEAALAVQMAGCHALTTDLIGRAAGAENLQHMQAFGNMAVKLQRTFTAQIEALARLRGKGQQTVRVEHVTVHPGGQAIVGDVHHHPLGAPGGKPEMKEPPHATTAAAASAQGRSALPSPDAQGLGVPITSHAERPVPAPRRTVTRRPRQSERP